MPEDAQHTKRTKPIRKRNTEYILVIPPVFPKEGDGLLWVLDIMHKRALAIQHLLDKPRTKIRTQESCPLFGMPDDR